MQFRKIILSLLASSALAISASIHAGEHSEHHFPTEHHVRHVLLISVDGLHESMPRITSEHIRAQHWQR